jgi:hypothetical protein
MFQETVFTVQGRKSTIYWMYFIQAGEIIVFREKSYFPFMLILINYLRNFS